MITDVFDDIGPIDHLVLEFPADDVDGLTLLVDLIDRSVVRLLDLVFVRKDRDGSLIRLAITNLDDDGNVDLAIFEDACADLLDPDEAHDVSTALPPGGHPYVGPGGGAGGQRTLNSRTAIQNYSVCARA